MKSVNFIVNTLVVNKDKNLLFGIGGGPSDMMGVKMKSTIYVGHIPSFSKVTFRYKVTLKGEETPSIYPIEEPVSHMIALNLSQIP